MDESEIHRGTLRVYGGFIFKQWKRRFLLLTAKGSVLVSRDASSPPDQMVLLHRSCEAIVDGKEILDLPRLPSDGCRERCFALILRQNKYLLLLTESAAECSQWLNVLKTVKQSLSSSLRPCQRHQVGPGPGPGLSVTLCDLVPEQMTDKPVGDTHSPNQKGESRSPPQGVFAKGRPQSLTCLRHGNTSNPEAVKAVYVLMGAAAASSALGYLSPGVPSHLEAEAPHLSVNAEFSEVGGAGTYHSGSAALDSPHYNTFDFDVAHSDYDAFDCGGFSF